MGLETSTGDVLTDLKFLLDSSDNVNLMTEKVTDIVVLLTLLSLYHLSRACTCHQVSHGWLW
jgi:hypothetical protein